jgi:uncharacterized protein YycO
MKRPIAPNEPAILLFRGRGILSTLIRWQSRGKYSHAAILLPNGRIVESWQGSGVRIKKLKDWRDIDAFAVPGMTTAQWDDAIEFAIGQVGKGYDYLGVLRFVSRRPSPENERWFCSELVFDALRHAGVDLFERIEGWAVSPGLLEISPRLEPVPER